MPLVFVHGVSTRDGSDYRASEASRDALFAAITLADVVKPPGGVTILNPYWGRFGATFAWENLSVPHGEVQALGGGAPNLPTIMLAQSGPEQLDPGTSLVDVATTSSLEDAIDLLWAASAELAPDTEMRDLTEFALRASTYAAAVNQPSWLRQVADNEQFVDRLRNEVDKWQSIADTPSIADATGWQALGTDGRILNRLLDGAKEIANAASRMADRAREAAGAVVSKTVSTVSRLVVGATRDSLHEHLVTFLGDVFVYIDERDKKGAASDIVREVTGAIRAAAGKKVGKDPLLILVGHSMGGIILYDVLTSFLTDVPIDALITVGSQVPVIEEMKLFKASSQAFSKAKGNRVPKPPQVQAWINIFDRNDILSFVTADVFEGTRDFEYVTGRSPLSSHGAYFVRPSFHQRLRARLREALP